MNRMPLRDWVTISCALDAHVNDLRRQSRECHELKMPKLSALYADRADRIDAARVKFDAIDVDFDAS